jgi:hypothetical protein
VPVPPYQLWVLKTLSDAEAYAWALDRSAKVGGVLRAVERLSMNGGGEHDPRWAGLLERSIRSRPSMEWPNTQVAAPDEGAIVYDFTIDAELRAFLAESRRSFADWMAPDWLEDPWFQEPSGRTWLFSTTHEGLVAVILDHDALGAERRFVGAHFRAAAQGGFDRAFLAGLPLIPGEGP